MLMKDLNYKFLTMNTLRKIIFALLFLPLITILDVDNNKVLVACEDKVEEEMGDDEAVVDDGTASQVEEMGDEEDKGDTGMKGSPDVDTIILFTKPSGDGKELPAGKLVEFLVGFTNNGDKDFVLDSIDASFRYPMDFSFYIQNFTAVEDHRSVKPRQETTLVYSFYPAEAFAGRPFGFSVNLAYHSIDGDPFVEAIFNQTVNITEVDEGLDGETFFLYVFLLAFAVLLLLAGHHFLSSFGSKKTSSAKKPAVETGTNIKDGIDYDWIPKELLNDMRKNHKIRSSPNSRESKREERSH